VPAAAIARAQLADVVAPLLLPPPQANRRREEPTTATSVEVRIFM